MEILQLLLLINLIIVPFSSSASSYYGSRFAISLFTILLAVSYIDKNRLIAVIFALISILFSPVLDIFQLTRDTWISIDIIVGIFVIFLFAMDYQKYSKARNSKNEKNLFDEKNKDFKFEKENNTNNKENKLTKTQYTHKCSFFEKKIQYCRENDYNITEKLFLKDFITFIEQNNSEKLEYENLNNLKVD